MMISGGEKEKLRQSILELGFDVARFADIAVVSGDRLLEWFEAGFHADMDWMRASLEKRLNPCLVLPEASSVLMLGVNYFPDDEGAASQSGFAKYSLYRDYHDTVLQGLKQVGELLESGYGLSGSDYRYYVDTGPVLERGWATKAGLGWQGKNGMLISKEFGNWLFLATIFLRLPVQADSPLTKKERRSDDSSLGLLCGKCTRCLEACPTNAIVEPGILDTRLCISYQTIENKGAIPRELRPKLGGRIYGCDICLDVCPWNRFAKAGRMSLLESRYAAGELTLLELLELDAPAYQEIFRKMPQKRTKLRGLKRNACVAAGNLLRCDDWWPDAKEKNSASGRDFLGSVIEQLIALAEGEVEPLVRAHAVWAVYQLCEDADERLRRAREREADSMVLDEYAVES